MTQFDIDYQRGKQSELQSKPDLDKIFNCTLTHDPEEFAHFDFFTDNIFVELKTRDNTEFKNGKFFHTTRKGNVIEIDSLYFDAPKMRFAYQRNKYRRLNNLNIQDFYIVWKCSGKYFYWKLNWDKKDYYIEEQFRDCGHGYKQNRDVINVKIGSITSV